jgi:hypothetical protein
MGSLHPALSDSLRVFGLVRLWAATPAFLGRGQPSLIVPTRLFHDAVAVDAIRLLKLRKRSVG